MKSTKNTTANEKNYFGKLRKAYSFARDYMQKYTRHPYHNFEHAKDVGHAALKLAKEYNLKPESRLLLATAALFHDIYFKVDGHNNEECSAEMAKETLPCLGYSYDQAYDVSDLVLATRLPTKPKNRLEEIMCDADVDNLGRPDALHKGYLLMHERGITDYNKWHIGQYAFMIGHKYYTDAARKLRDKGKEHNLRLVAALL